MKCFKFNFLSSTCWCYGPYVLLLQLKVIREKVAEMSGRDSKEVRVVVSPYRICPLGAHIDHQVRAFNQILSD